MKFFSIIIKCMRRLRSSIFSKNADRGAIAIEYALGMMVAATMMIGVEMMFRRMAIDIINFFKQLVTQFPNI